MRPFITVNLYTQKKKKFVNLVMVVCYLLTISLNFMNMIIAMRTFDSQ